MPYESTRTAKVHSYCGSKEVIKEYEWTTIFNIGVNMKVTEVKCDICGISNKNMVKYWSISIEKLFLGFKDFPNIQANVEYEDCCTTCAKRLYEAIYTEIDIIRVKGVNHE